MHLCRNHSAGRIERVVEGVRASLGQGLADYPVPRVVRIAKYQVSILHYPDHPLLRIVLSSRDNRMKKVNPAGEVTRKGTVRRLYGFVWLNDSSWRALWFCRIP